LGGAGGMATPRGRLSRNRVYLSMDDEEVSRLARRFGEVKNGKLVLSPLEALYLVDKGRIEVVDREGRVLGFEDLLNHFASRDSSIFPKFLIYRDLTDRGYKVVKGYSDKIDLLVYEKGAHEDKPARIRVIGIDEGRPVKVSSLVGEVKRSLLSKKDLKLAVIERRGEVVYYTLSLFKGERLLEEE